MGEYYCDICKFYDDDVSSKFVICCYVLCALYQSYQPMHFSSLMVQTEKGQYHCNDCGICR
jgi:hypothetical protein